MDEDYNFAVDIFSFISCRYDSELQVSDTPWTRPERPTLISDSFEKYLLLFLRRTRRRTALTFCDLSTGESNIHKLFDGVTLCFLKAVHNPDIPHAETFRRRQYLITMLLHTCLLCSFIGIEFQRQTRWDNNLVSFLTVTRIYTVLKHLRVKGIFTEYFWFGIPDWVPESDFLT